MFLKRLQRRKNGKGHTYWALVESIRTAKGSRHRVVAYLGELKKSEKNGWAQLCRRLNGRVRPKPSLFDPPHYDHPTDDEPVLVKLKSIRLQSRRAGTHRGHLVPSHGLGGFAGRGGPPGAPPPSLRGAGPTSAAQGGDRAAGRNLDGVAPVRDPRTTRTWSAYHPYAVHVPPVRDPRTTRTWSAYHPYATRVPALLGPRTCPTQSRVNLTSGPSQLGAGSTPGLRGFRRQYARFHDGSSSTSPRRNGTKSSPGSR